jgi:hypothetical protein
MQELLFNLAKGQPCRSSCSLKCNFRWIAKSFEQKDIPSNILCPHCGDLAFEIVEREFCREDIEYCPSCGLVFALAQVHSQTSDSNKAFTVKILLKQTDRGKKFALVMKTSDLANLFLDSTWFWTSVSSPYIEAPERKVKRSKIKAPSNLRTSN